MPPTTTAPLTMIEPILAAMRMTTPAAEQRQLERFLTAYYAGVDPADLAERMPVALLADALSHRTLAAERAPGTTRLRVANPPLDTPGPHATHTVIEIVHDDMPFLVDSVTMAINQHALSVHLLVHPVLPVRRDAAGLLVDCPAADAALPHESWMRLEIDRVSDPARLDALGKELEAVLGDVRAAVGDWRAMLARLRAVIGEVRQHRSADAIADSSETVQFLEWLAGGHFTLVGYRCHDLVGRAGAEALQAVPDSGLGILAERVERLATNLVQLPAHLRRHARTPEPLILTKSNSRSTIHRPGFYDYVGVRRFDASGQVCGEHRFLGLYTSAAYSAPPATIPLLRRKVADVIDRAGLTARSHAAKSLAHILDTYPRDELIQASTDELLDTALGMLHLGERRRFRLFMRRDRYERFIVCLVFVPRENFSTDLRRRLQAMLMTALGGHSVDFDVNLSESPLARLLLTVRTTPGALPTYDLRALETALAHEAERWEDRLAQALIERLGEDRGNTAYQRFGTGFTSAYREDIAPAAAAADIELLINAAPSPSPSPSTTATVATKATAAIGMMLYRPADAPAETGMFRFKVLVTGAPLSLSDSLPMLERLGMRVADERSYRIAATDLSIAWRHDFGLLLPADTEVDLTHIRPVFETAFGAVLSGAIENDDFNRLVVRAQLDIADIVVLRAYARYLYQLDFPIAPTAISATLAAHPAIARALIELFVRRLDPARADDGEAVRIADAIESALERVANLNEDQVLRQLRATILATTRTNFFVRDADGARRPVLALKLDPAAVPGMPLPRPMFEIFVYAARFEGVHLRGGKVARGGLRWSDRPEDFRTEVLGLMKAQMVKNTVIVPVGSKGGFVLKQAPSATDRDAFQREGIACYRDYLRGLLDVTDNLVDGKIVPPRGVHRRDGDDPYLVVAADKGTASFSDHANAIAREYGYWLDDAFASGGSAGYDHKAMAITARGAWESVKRHFREIGHDIVTTPFTVAGIGDMSGDVFGNGMLLSERIRLVAAFDHRHIFIDPDPDPTTSYAERERLFRLPRSSWGDYDATRLSAGGGVWPRTAKTIVLSVAAQRALGVEPIRADHAFTTNQVIQAILTAPVDLLYNGGIGTYVKARSESHAEAGDHGNDNVRVDGRALRAKVVVEGGNLGFTQRGRIEYAQATGGRINTDAIDNSAGVETSDHEVNIKVLLALPSAEGKLERTERDALLASMTDGIAALVLRDNTFQNQSLALGRRRAPELLDGHARFIRFLEKAGRLDRAIEFLPDEEEIAKRRAAGQGLTVPEQAVLLAYCKIWLYDELIASGLPDDPWVATALSRYFPEQLVARFATYLPRHPLRREIIATHVTNSMINRVGSIFVHRLTETTGARPPEIVRAYLLAREVFGYVPLWQAVESLGGSVREDMLAELLFEAARTPPATAWFLRSPRLAAPIAETIELFRDGVDRLEAELPALLDPSARERRDAAIGRYTAAGVPLTLATRVGSLDFLGAALDLIEVAATTGRALPFVARVHFAATALSGGDWLGERIARLPADTHWQLQANSALRGDLARIERGITTRILGTDLAQTDAAVLIETWQARHRDAIDRALRIIGELRTVPSADAAMLSVALRELRELCELA